MDYLYSIWEKTKNIGVWYRRYMYYYIGYLEHELRLGSQSDNISVKLAAVKANDLEKIKIRLFSGEWNVDDVVSINNMTTMLHEAVVMDRKEIISFLLNQGANPNIRDRNGMTPMLKAAALGREFAILELVKYGVNPQQRDPYGYTPYEKAVLHEEWKAAELIKSLGSYVTAKTEWKWPPDI
jgi:ankyrin repeat protein